MYLVRLIVGMDNPAPIQVPQQGAHSSHSTQRSQKYKKTYDSYIQAELIPNTTMIVKNMSIFVPNMTVFISCLTLFAPNMNALGTRMTGLVIKLA